MLVSGLKVAALASAVACYIHPQIILQSVVDAEQDGADADASVRVMRGLLSLVSFGLSSFRPSWFWVFVTIAVLQMSLWGLQLSDESLFGIGVEAEKFLFQAGAVLCFTVVVGIILFGGNGDNKARFRKRVVAFYTKHNPEKLQDVDDLVEKYQLNEKLLFERLHRKYNALAAGEDNHSVMKKIDESEFLYEQSEEEDVESEEEEQPVVLAPKQKGLDAAPFEKPVKPAVTQQRLSSQDFQRFQKRIIGVTAMTDPDMDDEEGTPPVSPRTAEKLGLAFARRQSSTLIHDAIAIARQAQQDRIEQRIANISSKSGDGYAGH
ncbi:hypothetical protein BBO99_00001564 [Phytophthora kernoviae]|uniref:Uncharacterized protein n=1 Tax=Phytophthora kernoviae TaxID=325452 RepID=A0A3R7J8N3_9STRA|nr:hypothetical protein JM18_001247 [Phytophthora kernoviae]RLN38074.1 hypothetical protein BBI17_001782 [Phytophthora kernoviae]RLN84096.1 hypothetical protein BBO99_00001564 [Phytophthora kernoviae]